jgi:hypothetical protein
MGIRLIGREQERDMLGVAPWESAHLSSLVEYAIHQGSQQILRHQRDGKRAYTGARYRLCGIICAQCDTHRARDAQAGLRFEATKAVEGDHRPLRVAQFDTVRSEACYGLRTPSGELAGVAVFAAGPAPESGDLCGPERPSSGRPSRPANLSQGSPTRGVGPCGAATSSPASAPPNAALPSASRRRRSTGARAQLAAGFGGGSIRGEAEAPLRNGRGRRGRSNASPIPQDRHKADS